MPPAALKLKQKLAALSQSTLSTTNTQNESPTTTTTRSSPATWSPATAKRKFFNNPPSWMKSSTSDDTNHAPEFTDPEVVQEVLSRMIFQAGVDFE